MSEFSGGPGPPRTFNLNDHLHRGEMPPLTSSIKKKNPSYKALKTSFINHPSDVEKYFVISGDAVRHMDVFEIQESLEKISSVDFKTCTILGSGDILIQTQNALQIESLKATSTFGSDNQPVSISENGVLNQSQALVRSKHLAKIVVERICSKLSDQKVVNVQRLKRKEGNIWVDTPTHLLTFNTPIVPNEVRCGVLNLKTEIYIPAPFRCVRCQKIGHTKKRCDVEKNQHICGNCAKEFHDGECTSPSKCVNCGNAHPSFSKLCPRYLDEKEINAIRVTERIPYSLARAEFRKRRKIPNLRTPKPYSDVLQASSSRTQMSVGSDFSQQSREIPSSQELLHIPESQHMLATSSSSFASTSASSTNNANSLSPSTSTNINSTNTPMKAAILIQRWYRRYLARMEVRRRFSWTIFQNLEYAGEQDQLRLYNFFNALLTHIPASVKKTDANASTKSSSSEGIDKFSDESDDLAEEGLSAPEKQTYRGPHITFPLTKKDLDTLIDLFRKKKYNRLHPKYVAGILREARESLMDQPNLNVVSTSISKQVTICGDLHGKLDDLLVIFHKLGDSLTALLLDIHP
ncbi:hypothetical protein DMENIID0001_022870 [Sergentomyia squamirostris]